MNTLITTSYINSQSICEMMDHTLNSPDSSSSEVIYSEPTQSFLLLNSLKNRHSKSLSKALHNNSAIRSVAFTREVDITKSAITSVAFTQD